MRRHDRQGHQYTAVAAVRSVGGVFSLVRLWWTDNLTDFHPRRYRLEVLRYITDRPTQRVRRSTHGRHYLPEK